MAWLKGLLGKGDEDDCRHKWRSHGEIRMKKGGGYEVKRRCKKCGKVEWIDITEA